MLTQKFILIGLLFLLARVFTTAKIFTLFGYVFLILGMVSVVTDNKMAYLTAFVIALILLVKDYKNG